MAGKTVRIPEQLHDLLMRTEMDNLSFGVTISVMQNLELARTVKSPSGKMHWVDYEYDRLDLDAEGMLEGEFEFIEILNNEQGVK